MALQNRDRAVRCGQILIHTFFIIACVSVILPVVLTLIVSFSSEMSVVQHGYQLIPTEWSLDAYRWVFRDGSIFKAYGVTIIVTVVGTIMSVFITSLAGFALSQRRMKHRNKVALYFYLPTIVSAGVVAWYYNIAYVLNLSNTIWVLILPSLVGVYNIFLARNYYKTIPDSLQESAEIDGATPFKIFASIMFPLALPITATILLFISLGYWNDWYLATWFIDTNHEDLYPLQYYLQMLWTKMNKPVGDGNASDIPQETVYVATMFITMGPIILVYPFIQKYFIKGIMVGAVKG